MPFLLLLIMALACLPEQWPQPLAWICLPGDLALFATLTGLSVFALVALAASQSAAARSQILRHPGRRELIYHRHQVWRRRHFFATSCLLLVQVYVLGWGWTVQHLCTLGQLTLPGAEVLVLAPFLLGQVFSWAFFYQAERALHDTAPPAEFLTPFWSRGTYVLFHLRQSLALIAAPLLLLFTEKALRRLFPESQSDAGLQVTSIALIALMFICLPWVLRLALGLKPLPEGALRERLLASARRLRFRCNNILLWNTHGYIANAMVAGILPWLRYVLLSDRLVSELTPDEVEAVFGHEIGHVKHRHMTFYLGFLIISLWVVGYSWNLTMSWVFAEDVPAPPASHATLEVKPPPPAIARVRPAPNRHKELESLKDLEALPLLTITGAYIFVVFGFLSRRCERQADIYGCRAVSCSRTDCAGHDTHAVLAPEGRGLCPTGIRIFIDALEKVADINGISRSRPGWLQSWQHSTIARRVEFLQRVLLDPTLERRFQRTVGLVKWGLLLFLGAALWALVSAGGRIG